MDELVDRGGVWTSVIGADIGSHLDRSERDGLSGVCEMVGIVSSNETAERGSWTKLYAIVGPGREITSGEIADLRNTIAEARVENRQIVAASIRINQSIKAFDLPANPQTIAEYGNAGLATISKPIAQPNGTPYGQAPGAKVVARVRSNPYAHGNSGMPEH